LELNQEKQYSKESHIKELIEKAEELGFDQAEIKAIGAFGKSILESNLIKGERPATINR